MPTPSQSQPATQDSDFIIPARRGKAFEVAAGSTIRFTDVEGQQCADLIAFDLQDLTHRMSPFATVSSIGRIYVGAGDVLVSQRFVPMLTIVEDTVGTHDILCGSCSPGMNRARNGGLGAGKRTCHVNFVEELRPYNVAPEDIPYSLNIFMNYPIDSDGTMDYATCKSQAGDTIDMRAERDLLVVVSNCPQELTPLNGFNPTSSRIQILDA
ncbi:MAG: urea carboxylase-associated family protein [Mycobacterium sp.]